MPNTLWLNDSKLIINDAGKVVVCDSCPCDESLPSFCDGSLTLPAVLHCLLRCRFTAAGVPTNYDYDIELTYAGLKEFIYNGGSGICHSYEGTQSSPLRGTNCATHVRCTLPGDPCTLYVSLMIAQQACNCGIECPASGSGTGSNNDYLLETMLFGSIDSPLVEPINEAGSEIFTIGQWGGFATVSKCDYGCPVNFSLTSNDVFVRGNGDSCKFCNRYGGTGVLIGVSNVFAWITE